MSSETALPQVEVCEESCPICLETLVPESTFVIKGCNHSVCQSCATQCRSAGGHRVHEPFLDVHLVKCPICRSTEELTEAQKAERERLKKSRKKCREVMLTNAANAVAAEMNLEVTVRFIPKGRRKVGMPHIVIPMAPVEERVPPEIPARPKCCWRGECITEDAYADEEDDCDKFERCMCGRPCCDYCLVCEICDQYYVVCKEIQDRYALPFEIRPPYPHDN